MPHRSEPPLPKPLSAGGLPPSSLPRLQPGPLIAYTAAGTPGTINPTWASPHVHAQAIFHTLCTAKLKCMPLISTDSQCFSTFVIIISSCCMVLQSVHTVLQTAAWFFKLYTNLSSDRAHSSFLSAVVITDATAATDQPIARALLRLWNNAPAAPASRVKFKNHTITDTVLWMAAF